MSPVRTSPSASARPTSSAPAGPALSRPIPSANGSTTISSTDGSPSSASTSPSAGKWRQDSSARSRRRGVRSCKNSGPPLGTADFGPYLAQLKRDVDAVYAVFSGADALRFAKQYEDAGLKARLPLIGGGTFTDEHVLRTMGDEVLGSRHGASLLRRSDNPGNRKFAQAYEAKFKQIPRTTPRAPTWEGSAQARARGDRRRRRER